MSNWTKNDNVNYLIDPTFNKVNRLLVLSFENEEDITSFSNYYVPNIHRKDFNVLIDSKTFFNTPINSKAIIETGRINHYTTGNVLDYEYFLKHYKTHPTCDVSFRSHIG